MLIDPTFSIGRSGMRALPKNSGTLNISWNTEKAVGTSVSPGPRFGVANRSR